MHLSVIVFVFLLSCVLGSEHELPDYLLKCNPTEVNSDCHTKAVSQLLQDSTNLLAPLDPLELKKWELISGENSPVSIALTVRNGTMVGLRGFQVYKLSGFKQDMSGVNHIYNKGPILTITGPYTVKGKVLILPIVGNGMSNITIVEPVIDLKFTSKPLMKNGQIYMQTNDLKMKMTYKRIYVHLENLFNGDKTLSKSMNEFINENWMDIIKELKPSILKSIAAVLQEKGNQIFAEIPYEKYFY